MHLDINRERLIDLMRKKGWSKTDLSRVLDLNYSYIHRLLKGERNPGNKFFSKLLRLCREENLIFEDFVYININDSEKL